MNLTDKVVSPVDDRGWLPWISAAREKSEVGSQRKWLSLYWVKIFGKNFIGSNYVSYDFQKIGYSRNSYAGASLTDIEIAQMLRKT